VISLKKYLEMTEHEPAAAADGDPMLSAVLASYRSALSAMGASAARACPAVGYELKDTLDNLARRAAPGISEAAVKDVDQQVVSEVEHWGEHTEEHLKTKTAELKELLMVLTRTAESVGERDRRHSEHFRQLTERLQSVSKLEDLTTIRASLVQGAAELKSYVDEMKQESCKAVAQLKAEVSSYETKLKEAEELALRDPMTGLANRRSVEEHIAWRVVSRQPFCVAMLDLNRLKRVNDKYGHLAGDNLLKQFSHELKSSSRSTDMVGRWGGDEFILVLDCDLAGANTQLERMQKWVFGEYTIRPGKGNADVKVTADAAIGLAQWEEGETLQKLIERADMAMYQQKKLLRK